MTKENETETYTTQHKPKAIRHKPKPMAKRQETNDTKQKMKTVYRSTLYRGKSFPLTPFCFIEVEVRAYVVRYKVKGPPAHASPGLET